MIDPESERCTVDWDNVVTRACPLHDQNAIDVASATLQPPDEPVRLSTSTALPPVRGSRYSVDVLLAFAATYTSLSLAAMPTLTEDVMSPRSVSVDPTTWWISHVVASLGFA